MLNDSSPPKSCKLTSQSYLLLTESSQNAGSPEHFSAESRQEEKSPHSLSEGILERIQHGDISLLSHLVGEENATWTGQLAIYNIYQRVLTVCVAARWCQ
jgi:hypothetical protein